MNGNGFDGIQNNDKHTIAYDFNLICTVATVSCFLTATKNTFCIVYKQNHQLCLKFEYKM